MEQRIIAPDVAQGLLDGTTPGPWNDTRVKWSGNGSARSHEHQLCNAQGVGVAIVTHDGSAEALANDRLHAAAPDLARSVIAQHAEFDRITDQAAAKIGESEADLSTARGEIARLRAEVARLTRERDDALSCETGQHAENLALAGCITEALDYLSNVHALGCEQPDYGRCDCDVKHAREALTKMAPR